MPLPKHPLPDPIYASSIRELKWILAIWTTCFIWVVGYCVLYGYYEEEEPLVTVIGMPSWVFFGVFLPWLISLAVTAWFALVYMEDHDLDPLPKETLESQVAGAAPPSPAPPPAAPPPAATPLASSENSDPQTPPSENSDG